MQPWDAHGGIEYNLIMHKYISLSEVLLWKQPKYRHNSNLLEKQN
jgi:hypothetical protein